MYSTTATDGKALRPPFASLLTKICHAVHSQPEYHPADPFASDVAHPSAFDISSTFHELLYSSSPFGVGHPTVVIVIALGVVSYWNYRHDFLFRGRPFDY